MLLGRQAMLNNVLVDPSKEYLHTDNPSEQKEIDDIEDDTDDDSDGF